MSDDFKGCALILAMIAAMALLVMLQPLEWLRRWPIDAIKRLGDRIQDYTEKGGK